MLGLVGGVVPDDEPSESDDEPEPPLQAAEDAIAYVLQVDAWHATGSM